MKIQPAAGDPSIRCGPGRPRGSQVASAGHQEPLARYPAGIILTGEQAGTRLQERPEPAGSEAGARWRTASPFKRLIRGEHHTNQYNTGGRNGRIYINQDSTGDDRCDTH